MRYLKTNTATVITVGPFYDKTDGITPEVALTATNEKITFIVDNAGTPTLAVDANATGSGGSNDFVHVTNDDGGYYTLELAAANVNYLGGALLSITYATDHCPVFHEFTILPANIYDSMIAGTDLFDVNTAQWLGTACATPTVNGVPEVDVTHFGGTAGTFASGIPTADLTTSAKGAIADAVLDENLTGHFAASSLGARLQFSHSGACQAGGSGTTVVLASSASSSDDYYNGDLVIGWVTADRTNFFADYISDYTGASRTATVTGIPVSPGATYTYVVIPGGTIPGASAPTAGEVADAVADELLSGHTTEGSIGAALSLFNLHVGTAQAGGASSITLDATGSSATNDLYNYQAITIRSGTGAGQSRQITDYDGTTKVVTVNLAWTTQPSTDSNYIIHPLGLDAATVAAIATAVWAATRAGNATAGSFGEYTNADVTRLSGDATAADNAESFFDGTGYAGTNNVIPTVTAVGTLTTYTGNTPQTGDSFARIGAPAGASVSADVAAVKVDTAAILVDTGTTLDAALAVVDGNVDAIKAKTDSLTFTQAGNVDANVQKINDVTVVGDGSATPWGA